MEKQSQIEGQTIGEFFSHYAEKVKGALNSIDKESLEEASRILKEAASHNRHILVAGNGGSAAISDHLCCDWTKGTFLPGTKSLKTFSLAANGSLVTALGNDFGYENIFSAQIEMLGKADDVLVLISSSGNSPNIIKAAQAACKMKMTTIGLTGFGGGALAAQVDIHLHVNCDNYGIVEDCHQSLMHVLAQFNRVEKERES